MIHSLLPTSIPSPSAHPIPLLKLARLGSNLRHSPQCLATSKNAACLPAVLSSSEWRITSWIFTGDGRPRLPSGVGEVGTAPRTTFCLSKPRRSPVLPADFQFYSFQNSSEVNLLSHHSSPSSSLTASTPFRLAPPPQRKRLRGAARLPPRRRSGGETEDAQLSALEWSVLLGGTELGWGWGVRSDLLRMT